MGWAFALAFTILALACLAPAAINYSIERGAVRVKYWVVPLVTIHFKSIRSAKIVKASRLWEYYVLKIGIVRLHKTLWMDAVVIRTRFLTYIITPNDPDKFLDRINRELKTA